MKSLRVALVGCGIISKCHLTAFARVGERAQIVALCDTNREQAERARAFYAQECEAGGEARIETDYEAVLADPEIDAVDLALPHHLHAETAIAAARAGKQILCEKPLALTLEECDRMAAEADKAGVVLMHGENWRTAETAERAATLIREGGLGALVGLQSTYAHWQSIELNRGWRTRPDQAGGGHLIDGGIHFVDLLRQLGGEITHVHAMTARFRPELGAESEDTGVLNLRFSGGWLGQMFASHASRGRGASPILTVFGTEGCLTFEAFGGSRALIFFPHGREPEVLVIRQTWQDTFDREILHFLEVVQAGEPLRAAPADARANLQVILAAYESARTGREVACADFN